LRGGTVGSVVIVRALGETAEELRRSAASRGLAVALAVRQGLVSHLLVDTDVAETIRRYAEGQRLQDR